jgi:CRISPR-associated protein Cas8a1/Csx13
VEPSAAILDRFAIALAMPEFRPRAVQMKAARKDDTPGSFWADSVVRPLVAENLAQGKPWFQDFRRLVVGDEGKVDETRARNLSYEREGLTKMIEQPWDDEREKRLVEAIHDAMRRTFAAIARETGYNYKKKADANSNDHVYWNRRNRQMQRWRLEFAGARTPDDVRRALGSMWSRAVLVPASPEFPSTAPNKVLRDSWPDLLPIFCDESRWQLNRDLALLALASYGSRKADQTGDGDGDDGNGSRDPIDVDDDV